MQKTRSADSHQQSAPITTNKPSWGLSGCKNSTFFSYVQIFYTFFTFFVTFCTFNYVYSDILTIFCSIFYFHIVGFYISNDYH